MRKESKEFLVRLLNEPAPSNFETPAQRRWREYVEPFVDRVEVDVYGNHTAILPGGKDAISLMVVGHADEERIVWLAEPLVAAEHLPDRYDDDVLGDDRPRKLRPGEDPKRMWYYRRSHAWFAGFAPADDPELVAVVLVEHGGHGGKHAAPIATRVLQEALGDGRPPAGKGTRKSAKSGKSAKSAKSAGAKKKTATVAKKKTATVASRGAR